MRNLDDEYCSMNPFMFIKDTGGSNGEDDVEFKRILKTNRFTHEIKGGEIFPEQYRRVRVVERLFVDSYDNFFLSWMTQVADGAICNPYHHVGLEETTYDSRRYPEDIVPIGDIRIEDDVFLRFRHAADDQVFRAQRKALSYIKPPKKVETNFDGEPVDMLDI